MEQKIRRGITGWIIVAIFALFFAYDVWEGIGNFFGVLSQSFSLGIGLSVFGWCAIILGILAPLVLFFLALWVSRKQKLLPSFVIFIVALSVSAVIGVDLVLGTNAFLIFSVS